MSSTTTTIATTHRTEIEFVTAKKTNEEKIKIAQEIEWFMKRLLKKSNEIEHIIEHFELEKRKILSTIYVI